MPLAFYFTYSHCRSTAAVAVCVGTAGVSCSHTALSVLLSIRDTQFHEQRAGTNSLRPLKAVSTYLPEMTCITACRYARTGKDNRKEFEWFTKNYFLQRPTLTMVFLLVDSSISPRLSDLEYAVWLASKNVPFSIVFTKVDKRKKGQPKHTSNIISFKRALIDRHGFSAIPPSVVTSASAGLGKHELLGLIASLRVLFEKQSRAEKVRDKA